MQPRTFKEDAELLAFLMDDFCEFGSNRTYLLIAMARPKENETITNNNMPIFREIITRSGKIQYKYAQLKALADNYTSMSDSEPTFRLYITANARDTQKAFFQYQKGLIDYQKHISNGHEATLEKIKRLDREWESKLQQDGNKDDNLFIIDIDTKNESTYTSMIDTLSKETTIKTAIETPNGYHIITKPFNYPSCNPIQSNDDIEIKTDGLLFLKLI